MERKGFMRTYPYIFRFHICSVHMLSYILMSIFLIEDLRKCDVINDPYLLFWSEL